MRPGYAGFERVAGVPLHVLRGDARPCPYLPDRSATDLFTFPGLATIDAALYERMMDRGFRRSGVFFYRPACTPCRECVPIRVPVQRFEPSRSQRRVLRRNADVVCSAGRLSGDDEHFELYRRYQAARHGARAPGSYDDFVRFLVDSPIQSLEVAYRVAGRLVGVSIVDVCPNSLSSVYFYYDPAEARRSLGVYSGLTEIDECRRRGLSYWYIGFFVRGCRAMEYKQRFRPHEFLRMDLLDEGVVQWEPAADESSGAG